MSYLATPQRRLLLCWTCLVVAMLAVSRGAEGTNVEVTCTRHAPVGAWDTCTSLATSSRLAPATLMQLNPGLDCARLPASVCISTVSSKMPPACGKYTEVKSDKHGHADEGCSEVAARNNLEDIAQLMALNPGMDCHSALKAGQLLCVQEQEQVEAQQECADWEEIISDGKVDPCSLFPIEYNPLLRCNQPFPEGVPVKGCRMMVSLQPHRPVCTRYQAFTSDGETNYCLIKGNIEEKDALIKHLQLNPHLYCGKGAPGGTVVVCMEGYVLDPLEDVEEPGSFVRDHLLLKLLGQLQRSHRHSMADGSLFQGGTQGMSGTDAHFIRKARKLPHSFMDDAASLIHMATVGVQQYKRGGNQLLAHAAWGAVMKALAVADFSPALFDLQSHDKEFTDFSSRLLMTRKRTEMCSHLIPAAVRRPQLEAAAKCTCDPQQHPLRCELLLNSAVTALKHKELGPGNHFSSDGKDKTLNRGPGMDTVGKSSNSHVAAQHMSEDEALREAGADPSLGVMDASAVESYYANTNLVAAGSRDLKQKNTAKNKVIDGNFLKAVDALIFAKNEVCKKVKDGMEEMLDKLKEFAATCTVEYDRSANLCGGEQYCVSIGCPAIDFQIVNVFLKGSVCIALPRDNWIRCRAACRAMQEGYNALRDNTDLNCPEACIRYIGDDYVLKQYLGLDVKVCLGGSALNLVKWLDDLVPDFVERAVGLKWQDILCISLVKARLYWGTGLLSFLMNYNLLLGKLDLDLSMQLYRPINFPEVCDCNVSPWACQKFCKKKPGGVMFSGEVVVGFRINFPWPIPDFKLQHKEKLGVGEPKCKCSKVSTTVANSLCKGTQGLVPSSSVCAACPPGMIAPNGATCMACPAGSIPSTDRSNCMYCAVGYIAPTSGSTRCVKCSPPLKSTKVGGKKCTGKCPPGTGILGTSCQTCKPGTFNPGTATNAVCEACPRGSYAAKAGATKCEPCKPGTAAINEGSTACSRCAAGRIPISCTCTRFGFSSVPESANTGQATNPARREIPAATGTKAGNISTIPADQQKLGAHGLATGIFGGFDFSIFTKLSKTWCKGDTGCKSCGLCPAGTFAKSGDAECTPCPAGFYQPSSGKISCKPCPVGTATKQGVVGATSCGTCPAGTYSYNCRPYFVLSMPGFGFTSLPILELPFDPPAAPAAKGRRLAGLVNERIIDGYRYVPVLPPEQMAGKFAPAVQGEGLTSRRGGAAAKAAPPVFKSPFAFNLGGFQLRPTALGCAECRKCEPGFYTKKTGQSSCQSCPSGYYQPKKGSTSCLQCGLGEMSQYNGSTSCDTCTPGSYTFCNITAPDFNRYERAYFSFLPKQFARLLQCQKGFTHNGCLACPGVTYDKKTGKPVKTFSKLPTNTKFPSGCPVPCKPGTYSVTGEPPCKPCPSGQVAPGLAARKCTSCGKKAKAVAGIICLPCFFGKCP